MYKTVTPPDAKALIEDEGYRYLDVRTEAEFADGHADGAVNVPIALAGPMGMQPNPDFLRTMQANFPPDTKLVVGCKVGGRSARACQALEAAGYETLVNMDGGFHGRFDPMGQLVQPGWSHHEFPTSTENGEGVSHASLATRTEGR
jgi:rhodanese-related sulfurtransferase